MSFVCLHAQGANEIHTCTSDKMTQEEKYDPKLSPSRLKFTCKRKKKCHETDKDSNLHL